MSKNSPNLIDAFFYGIVDTGYVDHSKLAQKCRMLEKAGAKIIQLRAKKETALEREKLAYELLPIFARKGAPYFIINDDAALAKKICSEIPNAGLHIGQDDLSPQEARLLLGDEAIIGLSTHSFEQASAANDMDQILTYFAVGPVYATQTKPGRPAVGLDLIGKVKALKPKIPWFCIGGINAKTAAEVRNAGAERIVAVSDVLKPDDTAAAVGALMDAFWGQEAVIRLN